MSRKSIGIDLGTTFCCVGVWLQDRVEIIPNEQGDRTTPSYVSFSEDEKHIGYSAKSLASVNPHNTIYNIKRLMGQNGSDAFIQNDIQALPYKVLVRDDKPVVQVEYHGKTKQYTPEEISAMMLRRLRDYAEQYLGIEIYGAVITVPAAFNDAQRRATQDACALADLKLLRILNEPTAASIAYGLDKKLKQEQNVLVFDYGGGTFDAALLTLEDGIFEVKAVAGDTHWGGEDIDDRLFSYFTEEFRSATGKDLRDSARAVRRLRDAAERAKRILSSANKARIDLEALFDGLDFKTIITRSEFEEVCEDIFRSIIVPVEKVLRDARMVKSDVHEVVLVGGSARIPRVAQLLSDFFDGKKLNRSINPEEAVAHGAAVQAAILSGDTGEKTQDLLLLDVMPASVGIATEGNIFTPVIKRNTTVPTKKSEIFSTLYDNQSHVVVQILEGEYGFADHNTVLGTLRLNGIQIGPKGVPQIEVRFDIDANLLLTVTVEDKITGRMVRRNMPDSQNRLSSEVDKSHFLRVLPVKELIADDTEETLFPKLKEPNSGSGQNYKIWHPPSLNPPDDDGPTHRSSAIHDASHSNFNPSSDAQGSRVPSPPRGPTYTSMPSPAQASFSQREAPVVGTSPPQHRPPFDFFAFRRKLSPVAYEIPQVKNFFLPSLDWTGVLELDVTSFLGAGAFGEVYRGKWVNISKILAEPPAVAVKCIRVTNNDGIDAQETIIQSLRDEIYVWQALRSENVVPLIGVTTVQTSPLPAIVSMWMPNGTIESYIKRNPHINKTELIRGIARGLNALHGSRPSIIHGDLKPENVLVDEHGSPRLTDFGLSRILEESSPSFSSNNAPGTVPYMAPELLGEQPPRLGVSTDMYAFAVTAWQLLSGSRPYAQYNVGGILIAVVLRNERPKREPSQAFSDKLWSLIDYCWDREPSKRRDTYAVLRALSALL